MSLKDTIKTYFVEKPREFIKESKKIAFEDSSEFYEKYNNPLFMAAFGSYCIMVLWKNFVVKTH